jgi:hypothetical protein
MRQMINGRCFDVPTDSSGKVDSDVLRKAAGIPADRPLVLQRPDGTNQLINPGEAILVNPGQYFVDAPIHRRGQVG